MCIEGKRRMVIFLTWACVYVSTFIKVKAKGKFTKADKCFCI